MHGTARTLALTLVVCGATAARADGPVLAVYWQPPGESPYAGEARAAFAAAASRLGARLVDATPASAPPIASLRPQLAEAKTAYGAFKLPAAITALDELQRLADANGGGDLDGRELSELFLYRGLARLETGSAEAAWDDLVRAARLDPARVLDPARFPPRAIAAWRRATGEVGHAPRGTVTLDVPAGATVRVDGNATGARVALALGTHYLVVEADGYERYAGLVALAAPDEKQTPPLHAYRAPDIDRLLALGDGPTPARVLVGTLERAASGWRFAVRDIALADGRATSAAVELGQSPTRASIEALCARVTAPPAPTPPPAIVAAPPQKSARRWWPWVAFGSGVVVVTLAISLGVVYGTQSRPSIGGAVNVQ